MEGWRDVVFNAFGPAVGHHCAPCGVLWDQDRLLLRPSSSPQTVSRSAADTCSESQRAALSQSQLSASVSALHANGGVSRTSDGPLEKQPLQTAVQQQRKAERSVATLYSPHGAALFHSRLTARESDRRP